MCTSATWLRRGSECVRNRRPGGRRAGRGRCVVWRASCVVRPRGKSCAPTRWAPAGTCCSAVATVWEVSLAQGACATSEGELGPSGIAVGSTACLLARSRQDPLHRRLRWIRHLLRRSDSHRPEQPVPRWGYFLLKVAVFHGALRRGAYGVLADHLERSPVSSPSWKIRIPREVTQTSIESLPVSPSASAT